MGKYFTECLGRQHYTMSFVDSKNVLASLPCGRGSKMRTQTGTMVNETKD